jgi:hypothetical protein
MNRINFRIFIGGAFVLLGILMLLQRFNIFSRAVDIFWGMIFLLGAVYFLYRFALNQDSEWWAVIPGSALAGIGVSALLPGRWGGLFFLGFLGVGFFAVYIFNRSGRWWGLIPGGVLLTLGVTSALTDVFGVRETGGIFFLGLGLTFLLVAILVSAQWAYIPGVILLLMGVALGYNASFGGVFNYIWPVALIVVGFLFIFRFAWHK